MTRRLGLWLLVVLAGLGVGCSEPKLKQGKGAASQSFPGHDPPPLAELVAKAKAQAAPREPAEPYAPRQVEVPPLSPTYSFALPRGVNGKPFFSEAGGVQLVVDETLSDPITAKAVCMQVTTDCLQRRGLPNRRDMDGCMYSVATCKDNHPWDDDTPCCPASCKKLYEQLRRDGYSMMDAADRTDVSECYPAMREFLAASKRRAAEKSAQQNNGTAATP